MAGSLSCSKVKLRAPMWHQQLSFVSLACERTLRETACGLQRVPTVSMDCLIPVFLNIIRQPLCPNFCVSIFRSSLLDQRPQMPMIECSHI